MGRRPPGDERQVASADRKSFEAKALPHADTLYRVAYQLARNEHEAEDLVQETMLKAYRAFESFEEREFGIRPWLLKILNNTFLNRAVREKKAPRAVDQQTLDQSEADAAPPPPELDYEHLDEEVKAALDHLSPDFRNVLLLWATNEMTYQQIADALGLPIGTVMSRLHRARQQLVGALRDFARDNRIAPLRGRP
jgi:RNA polymerase sigma-70 factor, ECF subfamily